MAALHRLRRWSGLPGGASRWAVLACVLSIATVLVTGTGSRVDASVRWVVVPHPGPANTFSELKAIACPNVDMCVAVGDSAPASATPVVPPVDDTLAEEWDGHTWSFVPSPNQPGDSSSDLQSVACASTTSCFAVGHGEHADGNARYIDALTEHWNGRQWVVVAAPPAPLGYYFWYAVSCPGLVSCFAVGYNESGALTAHWNGTYWKYQANPYQRGTTTLLDGITCTDVNRCMAVGIGPGEKSLVEHWDGHHWSAVLAPIQGQIASGACPSANFCNFVGYHAGPFAEKTYLGKWSPISIRPYGRSDGTFTSERCFITKNCLAVGWEERTDTEDAVIYRWDGRAWNFSTQPVHGDSSLDSLTCPTSSTCYAVGTIGNDSLILKGTGTL